MVGSVDKKNPCLHFVGKGACATETNTGRPCPHSHDVSQFTLTPKGVQHVKGELARMLHNRNLPGAATGKGKGNGSAERKGGKGKGGKVKVDPILDSNDKHIVCRFFQNGDCKNGNLCVWKHENS